MDSISKICNSYRLSSEYSYFLVLTMAPAKVATLSAGLAGGGCFPTVLLVSGSAPALLLNSFKLFLFLLSTTLRSSLLISEQFSSDGSLSLPPVLPHLNSWPLKWTHWWYFLNPCLSVSRSLLLHVSLTHTPHFVYTSNCNPFLVPVSGIPLWPPSLFPSGIWCIFEPIWVSPPQQWNDTNGGVGVSIVNSSCRLCCTILCC